jgi:hypothetical protein
MSNAKLKEQIEAAKIALVHSAEAGAFADKPLASDNLRSSPSIDTDHAQPHIDSAAHKNGMAPVDNMEHADSIVEMSRSPISAETHKAVHEPIAQSDFEKLEVRLQGLEDQIKSQQRDLHTLLQKLRGIAAKSQSAAEPKKSKGRKKLLAAAALCVIGFGVFYYWLGAGVIINTLYQVTGVVIELIDTLAGKI